MSEPKVVFCDSFTHDVYNKFLEHQYRGDVDLKKSSLIIGKNIQLRDANVSDAEFILSLRTDQEKSKYLSVTNADVDAQKCWLHEYVRSASQAYFIIESLTGERLGTIRMYDPNENSFCWGSWIISKTAQRNVAIESALLVYIYGLVLGFTRAHFDVRKENTSVCKFHEGFGAKKISENNLDHFYEIELESILQSINKYSKFLPAKILIY